jgi:LPXTG-motif cell wall-anchored protein
MKKFKKLVAGIMAMAMVMTSAIAMTAVPASAASKEVTVYFQNTGKWSNVYAYLWAGSGNIKGTPAWPGKQMTKVSGTDNWYEMKYTAGAAFNVIFNDNAQPKPHQTANHTPKNLAADKEAYWFVPGGATESNNNNYTPAGTAITVYTAAQAGFPKPAAAVTTKSTTSAASSAASSPAAATVSTDSATPTDASPKTGDANENAPIMVTTTALLALAGIGTVLIRKKVKA